MIEPPFAAQAVSESANPAPGAADDTPPKLAVSMSPGFNAWLRDAGGSLAFSTYQVGKILFLGLNSQQQLSIFERTFPRSMGVAVSADARSLLLAAKTHIYQFDDLLGEGQTNEGYDALYAPHTAWITGDIDLHDVAFDANNEPLFISTAFNCIATVCRGYSFKSLWHPPFVSGALAGDRCHLNGMALQEGRPKYASCVATTDMVDGWREHRSDGGVVVDIDSNRIVLDGLSMPHSPRWYRDRLWLLNSGKGEFGWVDIERNRFHPVALCPGFARGLAFVDHYAVIGVSEPRAGKTFDGLPLQGVLEQQGLTARCGLCVIDLVSGEMVQWVQIQGVISELYDVSFLPNRIRPSAIGLVGSEIDRTISISPT